LTDPSALGKLVELIAGDSRAVLEIGAGLGALTRPLLERGLQVLAIERDRDLVPLLAEELGSWLNSGALQLLEADAKSVDYPTLLRGLPTPCTLAGNLPYQLTGPLLRLMPALGEHVQRVVLLVQLEVADRIVAEPGSAQYGALSVFLQARFVPRRAFVVRAGAFYPRPNVDSAVVVLNPLPRPIAEETPQFSELVHAAFRQRRKTLKNAWRSLETCDAERALQVAAELGISSSLRGETLSVQQFAAVASGVMR
jgi:16S rRNA (adenine1518-N6/adenine1519-N6)-dimethyltransferase